MLISTCSIICWILTKMVHSTLSHVTILSTYQDQTNADPVINERNDLETYYERSKRRKLATFVSNVLRIATLVVTLYCAVWMNLLRYHRVFAGKAFRLLILYECSNYLTIFAFKYDKQDKLLPRILSYYLQFVAYGCMFVMMMKISYLITVFNIVQMTAIMAYTAAYWYIPIYMRTTVGITFTATIQQIVALLGMYDILIEGIKIMKTFS